MEASASIEIVEHTLLSGGLILVIGSNTGLFAQNTKFLNVAVFLIVGMMIGPEALGFMNIKADSALLPHCGRCVRRRRQGEIPSFLTWVNGDFEIGLKLFKCH